jgi:hypothetical protein
MNFFDSSVGFVEAQWQQRLVQVCVFASLLFLLLGSYDLIDYVQKMLGKVGLKFGKDATRAVHAVIFGCLLYVLSRFVMDPVVKRLSNGVEGLEGDDDDETADEEGVEGFVEGQANQPTPPIIPADCAYSTGAYQDPSGDGQVMKSTVKWKQSCIDKLDKACGGGAGKMEACNMLDTIDYGEIM